MGAFIILGIGVWFIFVIGLAGVSHWRAWFVVMVATPFLIHGIVKWVAAANPEAEPMGLDLFAAILIAPYLLALVIGAFLGLWAAFQSHRYKHKGSE